jgi:mRNA interferase MazF
LIFDSQLSHEQKSRRPALTLSKKVYSKKTCLAIFCPITSQIKNYPFEVGIKYNKVDGVAIFDQFKSLDFGSRNIKFIEKESQRNIEEVLILARVMFG